MEGGVGRYTCNFVKALRNIDINAYVCSANEGNGEYKGLSPNNRDNSNLLLQIVDN